MDIAGGDKAIQKVRQNFHIFERCWQGYDDPAMTNLLQKKMAQRQTINIGEKIFKTKAESKDFVKAILNKYELQNSLDTTDFQFICELLKRHPEYDKKLGVGITKIIIKLDGNWGKTRCFHIKRIDGTETDFSYLNCIDNDTSREPLKMFKQCARSAVKDQVVSHLSNYIRRTIDNDNNVVCEKSQLKIRREQATVDHTPPITFDKILNDFLKLKNIEPSQIEYTGFGDNEYNKEFKDEQIKSEFANYHRQVAKLRVISSDENLRQKKKNFNEQTELNF